MNSVIQLFNEMKLMPPQLRRRAIFIEFLLRFYCTTMGLIYASFEAASLSIFWKIIMVCFVIDIIRNLIAPELTITPEKIRSRARSLADSKFGSKFLPSEGIGFLILIPYIFYVLGLCIYSPPHEDISLSASVRFLHSYQNFFGEISNPVRRFYADLVTHGYPNRAAVVSAMAIVSTCVFIIYMIYNVAYLGYSRVKGSPKPINLRKMDKGAFYGFILLWLPYLAGSNMFGIKWVHPDPLTDWDLYENNQPFIWYGLFIFTACFAGAYFFTILIAWKFVIYIYSNNYPGLVSPPSSP